MEESQVFGTQVPEMHLNLILGTLYKADLFVVFI